MQYCDYHFEINENGLKLTDKGSPDKWEQVDINKTPLNVGDRFILTQDPDGCMFFEKEQVPVQLGLFDE